jgi:metal-responsive CopG/Arc/MetJ family transcriptional regulator
MGNVRINLPDNLHRNLKRRAIDEETPMRDLLIKALQEYIERNPPLPPTVTPAQASKVAKKREKI